MSRKLLVYCLLLWFLAGCAAPGGAPEGEDPSGVQELVQPASTIPRQVDYLPPPSVRFEHLTVDDGLAHSEVTSIAQDSLGYMWFGTLNGLNKYDGFSFQTYRRNPQDDNSLRDNFIESIYLDSAGVLWIGTQDGWLERYERSIDGFTHFRV
ncbi:MAG: two-component regulator propeller domain-containing protein, partial [Anaerolineales bacterium]